MLGLMQDWPMTLDKIIEHARVNFPHREIVTRSVEGPIARSSYAELWRRAKQTSAALQDYGVRRGDRVATLAWNTARHMELWYGAMGMGAVLHTLNPRLFPDQLAWIINHAGDKIIFFDLSFTPLVEKIAPQLSSIERFVLLTDGEHMPETRLKRAIAYEDFIAGRAFDVSWGRFEENTAAGLCYTSGTTGDPKGVLYSHRSNFIHAMAANQGDCLGCGGADVVMPIVPMFHANAWALIFVAPMCGAKLVMPGAKLDGANLYELIETEQITFTAGVPTVLLSLLAYLRETKSAPTTLKRVAIGGAAAPEALVRGFEEDFGIEVLHGWGMTEMSPIGALAKLLPEHNFADHESRIRTKLKQGRTLFTVDMKLVDEAGATLPRDGKAAGRLLVRGPSVARGYFRGAGARNDAGDALEPCGFFDTGDIATIDTQGYVQIVDRAKDVIKSGGEWISSIDLENIALGAPGVACAAVIGIAHPKWTERPLLIIEPSAGEAPDKETVLNHLFGRIAAWWKPDDVVLIDKMPLGPTGKVDKRALRGLFADYVLPSREAPVA